MVFLACVITIWSCVLAGACFADSYPNIVVLLADDLGYGELGCQGNAQIPTPHIDSIARGGVRFTSGYVTASYCSASRAGLLTGRYQSRFGYDDNPTGARNELPDAGLPTSETTFATLLQNHGYATALVGKWHLGGTARFHPLRRGFDEFFGFTHEGHYFVRPPYAGRHHHAAAQNRCRRVRPDNAGPRPTANSCSVRIWATTNPTTMPTTPCSVKVSRLSNTNT